MECVMYLETVKVKLKHVFVSCYLVLFSYFSSWTCNECILVGLDHHFPEHTDKQIFKYPDIWPCGRRRRCRGIQTSCLNFFSEVWEAQLDDRWFECTIPFQRCWIWKSVIKASCRKKCYLLRFARCWTIQSRVSIPAAEREKASLCPFSKLL